MNRKRRIILVGIDGASFSMIDELSKKGIMNNFNKLIANGVFRRMNAPLPDNSAVSWSSMMTGKNPGEHGIFGFTDLIPNTYTISFPNFMYLKSKPFWQLNPNKKYVILNLPFTYPVQEINGYIISGFVSPDIKRSVYPSSFLDVLVDMDYKIDVDSAKARMSLELFLNDLFDVLKTRINVYRHLWQKLDWEVFMIVFTGSDRLEHFLLHAYEDVSHPLHSRFLEYFNRIDEEIGWIAENINAHDNLIILSDHGMELIKKEVNVNTFLAQNGFLKLNNGTRKNYNSIDKGTLAFAMEPSRIYINYKDLYPNGTVTKSDMKKILSDLIQLFNEFHYNGDKVIKNVYRKQDIYTGNQVFKAPDLLLVPSHGYNLRGIIGNEKVFNDAQFIKGMHKGDDAFLYVMGSDLSNVVQDNPCIEDVVNIMQKLEAK